MKRRGARWPHDITGARATGTAMTHMTATTTSKVHFHGVANAMRAPSASNSGYHPAAQIRWKTPKINAQSAAAYPHMLDWCIRSVLTVLHQCEAKTPNVVIDRTL